MTKSLLLKLASIICFCSQLLVVSTTAILNPIDFLALQSIRKSLHDVPGSNFLTSWDFTSDPCTFPGVTCDSNRVISLNLGDPRAGSPGLTGRIHPDLGKLTKLIEFTIVPGRVMGRIPHTISQLTDLRFFAVSRNYLSGEIPTRLGQLQGLHSIDLSYNQLTGSIPGSIGSLTSLSNIILSHNHLTGSVPSFLSRSLTRVDLMHNNLTGSIKPGSFPYSIYYLSLSWNKLTGPVDGLLKTLNHLNYLDLSVNRFTGLIPCNIFSFPITDLQLQRNQFYGPVQPVEQVKISTVDLSYNRLSGQISPNLSTVTNLYLNNNRFMGSVPVRVMDRLLDGTIKNLYLQHNYLSGVEINLTAEIPPRGSLCLQYNCMVPPTQSACPLKAGTDKTRPTAQCIELRG